MTFIYDKCTACKRLSAFAGQYRRFRYCGAAHAVCRRAVSNSTLFGLKGNIYLMRVLLLLELVSDLPPISWYFAFWLQSELVIIALRFAEVDGLIAPAHRRRSSAEMR